MSVNKTWNKNVLYINQKGTEEGIYINQSGTTFIKKPRNKFEFINEKEFFKALEEEI